MITLMFKCGGCPKEEPGTHWLTNSFTPFIPGGSFGTRHMTTAQDVAPEGWIAFDPYTQATYCPECWAGIESDDVPETAARA